MSLSNIYCFSFYSADLDGAINVCKSIIILLIIHNFFYLLLCFHESVNNSISIKKSNIYSRLCFGLIVTVHHNCWFNEFWLNEWKSWTDLSGSGWQFIHRQDVSWYGCSSTSNNWGYILLLILKQAVVIEPLKRRSSSKVEISPAFYSPLWDASSGNICNPCNCFSEKHT